MPPVASDEPVLIAVLDATESPPSSTRLPEERRSPEMAGPPPRELRVERAVGLAFLATALVLALGFDGGRPLHAGQALVLVLAYAVLLRVRFHAGTGNQVPTQLVLVTMLFELPTTLVPLFVLAALALSDAPDYLLRRRHPQRLAFLPGDAFHAIGPAVVLTLAGAPGPELTLTSTAVFGCALVAQLALDLGSSVIREWLGGGIAPRLQLDVIAWVCAVDVVLSPLGLLAAIATTASEPYAFVLALPLAALCALFAKERNTRIDQEVELRSAYRGTAKLLGDMLEEADEYTGGLHTSGVVDLSLRVADELGLDLDARRRVEFAALLHDVGKMAIPHEILNKPGPLDELEWEIMRGHTIDGQRMLEPVGGILRDVGVIVRASHERWDGRGYPDGLREHQIPREAAIVSVCDAFNAMTTDRPYRRSRTPEVALKELRANAGTQFDPAVVGAITAIMVRKSPATTHTSARWASRVDASGPIPAFQSARWDIGTPAIAEAIRSIHPRKQVISR
jgi:HD-GYP domain-containing protein (c-di-GMP phosphodiesterase class II)